jgi:hypothetical protein
MKAYFNASASSMKAYPNGDIAKHKSMDVPREKRL